MRGTSRAARRRPSPPPAPLPTLPVQPCVLARLDARTRPGSSSRARMEPSSRTARHRAAPRRWPPPPPHLPVLPCTAVASPRYAPPPNDASAPPPRPHAINGRRARCTRRPPAPPSPPSPAYK
jgi:hypothetical protein